MSQHQFPRLVDTVLAAAPQFPAKTPLELAYERVRGEIDAIADDELAALNVDIPSAVTTAQAAVPALREQRSVIAQQLPGIDLVQFDKLQDYADALAYLQTEFVHQDTPASELPAMYEEALSFRETVISVGRVLAKLQLIDSSVFDAAGSVVGYRNVAYELGNLCTRLLEKFPAIAARSPLTEEQLVRGKTLGSQLLAAVARKEQGQSKRGTVTKDRLRAYTLLTRAYNEARRAVVYLRWNEGDADVLAPSFYAGRSSGKKGDAVSAAAEGASVERAATNPTPTAPERAAASAPSSAPTASVASPEPSEPKGDPLFTPASDEPFIRS